MYNERFENDKKTTVNANDDSSSFLGGLFGFFGSLGFIYVIILTIMGLIWIIGGISAFFASLVCMFYDSSIADKIVGFFLAVFFGPLYWGFYIYKASYCNKFPPVNYYYE